MGQAAGDEAGQIQPGVDCVWVLSGAPDQVVPAALRWVPAPNRVVAADAGAGLAALLGVTPDLVVGDFDSVQPALLARMRQSGISHEEYEHHTKLETDTELAALAALRWNPERIIILGAIGGRLDHTLANILLLTHSDLIDRRVTIVNGRDEVFLAKPGVWNEVEGQPGDILTAIAVGEDATGVTYEGLEYPLSGETLPEGRGRGVSNVLVADTARVRYDSGKLLVIVSH